MKYIILALTIDEDHVWNYSDVAGIILWSALTIDEDHGWNYSGVAGIILWSALTIDEDHGQGRACVPDTAG